MKYVVILGDGMADLPIASAGGKTPLELAKKPYMDRFAKIGTMGLIQTVYEGMSPGSDVANLCVMGFDAKKNYTGRSPLEAASMGVELTDTDITYRMNLVTLSKEGPYEEKTMEDYSAGEISTKEAGILIEFLKEKLEEKDYQMFPGVSYRHLLLRKDEKKAGRLVPPHDISGKPIKEHLPLDEKLLSLMKESNQLLANHPINQKRVQEGKKPANSIWIWGEGTRPKLGTYAEQYGLSGSVISAVDLIKGIGLLTGLKVIEVEGATGTVHTNFSGKAQAAMEALNGTDEYLYVHIEAADESGHQGNLSDKIKSIELIDELVIGPIYEFLKEKGEPFCMLVLPDHPTPVELRTHTSDPVPFLLVKETDGEEKNPQRVYTESCAKDTGIYLREGHLLLEKIIKGAL